MGKHNRKILLVILVGLILALNGCVLFGTYSISGVIREANGTGIGGVNILYKGQVTGTVTSAFDGTFTIAKAKGLTTITPTSAEWAFAPKELTVDQATTNLRFTGTSQVIVNMQYDGDGTVTIYPEKDRYVVGDKVTVTPDPAPGYVFSHWTGSVNDDEEPLILTLDASKSLTAYFVPEDEVVNILDYNLEEAVRDVLNRPFGLITTEEALNIDTLDASIRPIETIEGLEYLRNLTHLNLSVTGISDIQPIAGLTKLEAIDLGYNNITSIAALTNLTNLTSIKLNDNQLSNITSMFWSSVKHLVELDLSNNKINDVRTLKTLEYLENLNLAKNNIYNISPLIELTTLRELNLGSNQIVNLSNISNLTQLEVLHLEKNKITDISELRWFWDKDLRELSLNHNKIQDLQPLAEMENLEVLELKDAGLSDISDLALLSNIITLDLSHNQITDLTALGSLTTLRNLFLHNNMISNIDPLVNLVNLEKLTLMSNDDLNMSKNLDADKVIQQLIDLGCIVLYDYYQNDAPILDGIGRQIINECDSLVIELKARDPNGDELTYWVDGDLTEYFDPETHTFTWNTGYEDAGIYNITFHISDGDAEISESVIIEVLNVNRPPYFVNLTDQVVAENSLLSFTVQAIDDDGQAITFGALSDDLDLNTDPPLFNTETGEFSWTPNFEQSGVYEVTFTLFDTEVTVSQTITITVNHVNRPPVLEPIGDQSVVETDIISFAIIASDPDADDVLTYTVTSLTEGVTDHYDPDLKSFYWETDYDDAGTYGMIITVSDGTAEVSEDITITIVNADRPPVLDPIGDQPIAEYTELAFTIHATDPDGDTITYSMTEELNGATLDPVTGEFSWTPVYEDAEARSRRVTFMATSGELTDEERILITISNVEFPPDLAPIGPQTVNENEPLVIQVQATDRDRNVLTYTANSDDLDLTDKWNADQALFSWTPGYDDSGIYHVTFTVDDGVAETASVSEMVTITVNHVNRPPVIAPIGDRTVQETKTLSFAISVTDLDVQDTLIYWATSETPGLADCFDPNTLNFSWDTDYSDEGDYAITFVASDGHVEVSRTIQITVTKLDRAPELIPIGNKDAYDNELLSFYVEAIDLDDDPITYSMAPSIPGATLDPTTGLFEWTPTNDQIRQQPYIIIITARTAEAIDTETIEIMVNDINHAPEVSISGNTTIKEGELLKILVNLTDVDDDNLTVLVQGALEGSYMNDPVDGPCFKWQTGYRDVGEYTTTILVTDNVIDTPISYEFTVRVTDVDAAPIIEPIVADTTFEIGDVDPISFIVHASDPDGDLFILSASGIPQGASWNPLTGEFRWMPTTADIKEHIINFTVTANGKMDIEQVTIIVRGPKLEINTLTISTSKIQVGMSAVTLHAEVTNVGNKAAPAFELAWSIANRDGSNEQFIGYTTSSNGIAVLGRDALDLTLSSDAIVQIKDAFMLNYGNYEFVARITEEANGGPSVNTVDFSLIKIQYALTLKTVGTGIITANPSKETYDEGDLVTISATPGEAKQIKSWRVDGEYLTNDAGLYLTDSSIEIIMDKNKEVVVEFESISLGGNTLAFISKRDSSLGEVYLMDEKGNITRLTNNNISETNIEWSPDGTKLLVEGTNNGNKEIYVLDVATKLLPTISDSIYDDISPNWGSNLNEVIFASNRSGKMDIFKTTIAAPRTLTQLTKGSSIPNVDPDYCLNLVVYSHQGDLWLVNVDGTGSLQLTSKDQGDPELYKPKWSPDGLNIIAEGVDGELYRVQFTDASRQNWNFPVIINQNGADNSSIDWGFDSSRLVYVSTSGNFAQTTDIFMMNVDGSGNMQLTTNAANDTQPVWSYDGSYVAFTSVRDGQKELYALDVRDLNNPVLIRLTRNSLEDSTPKWAP